MKDVAMFSVKIPGVLLEGLREAVQDKLADMNTPPKLRDELEQIDETLVKLIEADALISEATTLYEDDEIAVFEHPVKGDNAPVMGFYKPSGTFLKNTGFWDVGDPEEIREELWDAARI